MIQPVLLYVTFSFQVPRSLHRAAPPDEKTSCAFTSGDDAALINEFTAEKTPDVALFDHFLFGLQRPDRLKHQILIGRFHSVIFSVKNNEKYSDSRLSNERISCFLSQISL